MVFVGADVDGEVGDAVVACDVEWEWFVGDGVVVEVGGVEWEECVVACVDGG